MTLDRVAQHRRVRLSLHALMFIIVSALVVAPFTVASADTPTDPSTAMTPDLGTPTPPPDPALPDTTTPTTVDATDPPTTDVPVPLVTDAPTPTADDGDGIDAVIEDAAPNGGDGNNDRLVDSRQSNVASLPAAVDVNGNGTLDDYVTIAAPEGTTLTNVRALKVPSDNPPPDDVNLPYGLFEYDVTVASPGDTAEVTYVLPDEGVVPTSVHMLQNGVWTDFADHTSVDAADGNLTVALRDGGEGDETGTTNGVIEDPSGPSTSNRTITVTNVSGASAPNFTFRLERCQQITGSNCTVTGPVGTGGGAANDSGDSGALANGSSWSWGSPTALEYTRNYRLSVITPFPLTGWDLTGRDCDPSGNSTAIVGLNAIIIRLANSDNNRRATCSFTFTFGSGTITAHKGGLRNTGSNSADTFATGLQGATFEFDDNSDFTSPSDLCLTPVSTAAAGACVSAQIANGNYFVREKAAPAGWNTIPQIAYGGDAFGQSPLVDYNQQVTIRNSNVTTRRFVNRRSNPALTGACGLSISLVLDRSGSITPNKTTYANAAKSFVNSLALTPSQMKIFSFAATATADQNEFVSLGTQAGVNLLNSKIDAVYNNTAGGTNWDAGLQLAINSGSNLVVFITDGNPTARNGDTGSTNRVDLEDVEYGIASANSVKSAGQTIWAVGVANTAEGGITPTNLELVSGPGDFFTADLDNIQATLKALANQLCGSRIHVRKLVGGQPQTDWQFTAAGGGNPVTLANNPVVTSGAGGEGVIAVDNIPASGTTAAVTVTESLAGHPGFSLAVAACQLNTYPAAGAGTPSNPQSIAQIQRNQDWFCTFNNVFSKSPSTTATVIHNAAHATVTSVPAGTIVHDQATVTGGLGTPTGTVTFRWFTNGACTAPAAATSLAFTLDASGVADGTSFTQTPSISGAFAFQATYSGDALYDPSTGLCEPLVVTKLASSTATVIHDSNHNVVTSVLAGAVVHDQATVTGTLGTPTGTVTFSWFTNGTCTEPAAATSSAFTLLGGVADGTTFAQTPVLAGGYAFRATYAGDGTYNGSTGPCEPLTVTRVASTTATVIHNAAHQVVTTVPAGTAVHDQATVARLNGLPVPTGTVTFSWFTNGTCTAPVAATSAAFTLSGGVADATTFAQTPGAPGSFAFRASYSGDGTYDPSPGQCEPLVVTRVASTTVTVIHGANHATVVSVPAGTTVHDQATVTSTLGTPTGTVTFSWFTNGTCTGTATATSSPVPLNGSGIADATGFPQTPNTQGSFSFEATYSGDATHEGSTGACEPLGVNRVPSTTATDIHNAAHAPVTSVPAGTTVHDQATVTGQVGLPTPTGTVTFSWFTNGTCTEPAAATSSAFLLSGGVADGTTFPQTPGVSGSFAFQASYSGDGTYAGSAGPCEPLTVTTVASTTVTAIHNAAHQVVTSVAAGTTVHDEATVRGLTGLPTPTGTVTFSWFTNGACLASRAATSSPVPLVAGVAHATAFPQTPSTGGSFAFQASYSGDGTYAASTGPCEPLTVTKVASSTVTVIHGANHATVTSVPAGTEVHDQATVTGGLGTPTGTVRFSWFTNGTCAGEPLVTSSPFTLNAAGVADGTTFTQTPGVSGSFAFRATYSGDGTYNVSTGPCEPLTVTKVASSTVTVIHDAVHATVTSVPAGTAVHDQAMVTGGLGTPTGTVTFSWFTNGECTAPAAATSSAVALDTAGVADATGFPQTPLTGGAFAFRATYSGDGTYNGSTGPCEPLTATTIASSAVTVIHDAAHATVTSVSAGTTVHDQATVTGALGTPTGTVTFSWFTNGACLGIPAATSGAFPLAGGVADATTFTQTPDVSGNYAFRATYSGDGTYTGSTGLCEPLVVTKVASSTVTAIHNVAHQVVTSVAAGTTVHDQVAVTGALGTPTGTVTVWWFTNGTCASEPAVTSSSTFTLDASGAADATEFPQTPGVSGSFAFQALYSGDGTYDPSTGPCEPLTVTPIASSTVTVIHDVADQEVTSVSAGTMVHDQATVTGGLETPTGTVTFSWFTNGTCTGSPATTSDPFTLDAFGVADGTAFTQTPGVSGSFAFRATYSGDGTYIGSTGPCEPLTVTKVAASTVTVIHDAVHATVTSVPAGTIVHDQATVTGGLGTPTGTVTFRWFTNGACTAPAAATSLAFTLDASGVADGTSFTQTPSISGAFAFQATYSGDALYDPSTGLCEPLVVTKLASSTATVIHDSNHNVVTSVLAGAVVHDQATVTGTLGTPTGTVTFSWFTNGTCTEPAAATSSAFTLLGGVADGTTFAQTPVLAGGYAFRATYAGDGTYNGSTGPCEPLTVSTVASATATDIHDAAHQVVTTVPAGTTVHDQATVTRLNGLPTPTGTVTFSWFSNGECTAPAAATSSAVALDASGVADATGFTQTPGVSGSFAFRASYGGDGTYGPSTGLCEPLTVTPIASSTVTVIHDADHATVVSVPAGTTVHDQATVTSTLGTPTGTVTFSWFANGTCTGTAAATSSPVPLNGSGIADATGFPQTPNTQGSFSFQATYSGDATHDGSTGACEPLGVDRVPSTTATDIHNAAHAPVTSVPAGTTVHDQATVTGQVGLPTPTGTVTFLWFTNGTCTEPATAATSFTVPLDALGVADGTTFPQTPGVSGSFAFQASYSGDGTYAGSTGPCEPLTVTTVASTTATDIHNAAHDVVTTVPAGTTVHDQATVTGQVGLPVPTGSVTFSWFTNGECLASRAATSSTVPLDALGVAHATEFPQTPPTGGSFAFQASYSGDDTYDPSTGPCEPLTVTKVASSTVTVIHDVNDGVVTSVAAGTEVHDQATVTGGLGTPTGTVTFSWFTNGTCAGEPLVTSSPFTLDAFGVADGTAFTQTPGVSGSFAFRATYSGDGTYNVSTGPCEPLTVTTIASSTVTVIHDAVHATVTSVPAGTVVHDQATVTGQVGLPVPTGTVTLSWFSNGECTAPAAATSSAVALDASGVADATGFPQTPGVSGSFAFRATYSGDVTYNGSTGLCEPLTVTTIASSTATVIHDAVHATVTSVAAGTAVYDQATVTGGLGTPTGTVTFSWFTNGECSGNPAATSDPFTLDAFGVADGTTFLQTPGVSGSFAFRASYSGDGTHAGSTGPCEPLTVTKVASSTVTVIHEANHAPVTSVAAGTTVHDQAAVTGGVGTPTGTVTFSWFTNGTCAGSPAATSDPFTLDAGIADGTTFAQTPGALGSFAFRASYSGDGTYDSSTGPCEPLVVTGGASEPVPVPPTEPPANGGTSDLVPAPPTDLPTTGSDPSMMTIAGFALTCLGATLLLMGPLIERRNGRRRSV